ncbi:phytoene dehydrogenase-like protein [Stella humosa]|uniref:Pyridine nucleotide-disulfide oxidoreductase domain-containing protein 2 n=1 Tax=Stella humosa TaxID=94 RepID=A0A3N1M2Q1_9PROT|nr:NAD(P)/FAD-dependent oxidoreductase [Stella humosa]ROQ00002.1 phytoene dehydrogenase-like protein [Stella humosa]BBK30767.1 oxidoreductase [Stella humosa]
MTANRFDAIIIGGGHSGLVAAGYLAGAGLSVAVLEAGPRMGGPAATIEFMPGYRSTIANSPGSLEPKIVRDLALERHGLRFQPVDPTLVHPLADGQLFIGWRDRARTQAQIDGFAPGESARYDALFAYIEAFARKLGISVFREPPTLQELVRNITSIEDQEAFGRIFFGSARDLFDEFELAWQTQTIIAPMAVVGGNFTPSTPGTPINLLTRPLSLASLAAEAGDDPRRMPLRGSTGMPVGGMGAIADSLIASAASRGVTLRTGVAIDRILTRDGAVEGVVSAAGEEFLADTVISAVNPRRTVVDMLRDDPAWGGMAAKMRRRPMTGKAFKVVLALDGMPTWAAAPADADPVALASAQFRIAPSIDYLEASHAEMQQGRISDNPVVWGLLPSMTAPELAPDGKHVMSLNVGTAPYRLAEGDWKTERDRLARRTIAAVAEWMPDLPGLISDWRCLDPEDFEREFGLVEANMTHGDLAGWNQFWMRPLPGLHAYRTPTRGLYLSGNGTWPGNFISGLSGHNAAQAVLSDLEALRAGMDQPLAAFGD